MGYLKLSECQPGREYLCRYSGKRVLCIASTKWVDAGSGRHGLKSQLAPCLAFRYWNTVKEEFAFMEVLDDQLSEASAKYLAALAGYPTDPHCQSCDSDALIQRVVDYWDKWQGKGCIEADMEFDDIVTDMNKAGFKSTSSSDDHG